MEYYKLALIFVINKLAVFCEPYKWAKHFTRFMDDKQLILRATSTLS